MIYGFCEAVLPETKGGLVNGPDLPEKWDVCSWKPKPTGALDDWVWWLTSEESHRRLEVLDTGGKGICVEVGSLPPLCLGSLASGSSSASCYLASVSSRVKWGICPS